jgi:hypothetical protein
MKFAESTSGVMTTPDTLETASQLPANSSRFEICEICMCSCDFKVCSIFRSLRLSSQSIYVFQLEVFMEKVPPTCKSLQHDDFCCADKCKDMELLLHHFCMAMFQVTFMILFSLPFMLAYIYFKNHYKLLKVAQMKKAFRTNAAKPGIRILEII